MKQPKITSSTIVSGCVFATSLTFVLTARAEAATVVSPPGMGLEDVDGDVLFFFREPYPARPDVGKSTVRWQELHPASAFQSLGPGPLQITQIAWRPDASVYEPISNEWEGFHLLLSTTDVGTLRNTFSENFGPRGATDVFSGDLVLQTDGSTRGPGLPHDFDYVIKFERPFLYYPDEGDLLIDASLEVPTDYPWIWVDAQLTGEYVVANPIGPTATNGATGLFVTEFTVVPEPMPFLEAGDADQDGKFDQLDLVKVQQAAKYLTGRPATWGEGDWDGAPGGEPGNPPVGNGLFDQLDIVAALGAGTYLTGPYAAIAAGGTEGDGQTSIIYNPSTGEVGVDAPAGMELTSVNIDSAASIFTGSPAENLGGSFDNDADNNIFKATFGSSFGSLSFGNVAQTGLSEDFVLGDLTVIGSLAGGGDLGNVDLVYVPEPASVLLLSLGLAIGLSHFRRVNR